MSAGFRARLLQGSEQGQEMQRRQANVRGRGYKEDVDSHIGEGEVSPGIISELLQQRYRNRK